MDIVRQMSADSSTSEDYVKNTALRALMVAIPHIGSSIDMIISSRGMEIINKRTEFFINELSKAVRTLEETNLNKEYLLSEEFFDLFMHSLELARKHRSEEKVVLYVKILKGRILSKTKNIEIDPEDCLKVISELSINELKVAQYVYQMQLETTLQEDPLFPWPKGCWDNIRKEISELVPKGESQFILNRIERVGLIKEIVGGYFDYGGGAYLVTKTFEKIMKFIDEGA